MVYREDNDWIYFVEIRGLVYLRHSMISNALHYPRIGYIWYRDSPFPYVSFHHAKLKAAPWSLTHGYFEQT